MITILLILKLGSRKCTHFVVSVSIPSFLNFCSVERRFIKCVNKYPFLFYLLSEELFMFIRLFFPVTLGSVLWVPHVSWWGVEGWWGGETSYRVHEDFY